MKNLIKGIMIFSMASLFGCTKVVYTHDEVLGRYKTRDDVQKTFGIPTEKKVDETSELWLYQFDSYSLGKHPGELYHTIPTVTVNNFGKYDKYLLFSFDKAGNVVRCDYTGVDMTVRKKNTGGTIALIGGAVAVTAIVAIIAFSSAWNDTNAMINLFGD